MILTVTELAVRLIGALKSATKGFILVDDEPGRFGTASLCLLTGWSRLLPIHGIIQLASKISRKIAYTLLFALSIVYLGEQLILWPELRQN